MAKTLTNEYQDYSTKANKDDVFSKYNIPRPEERYTVETFFPDAMKALADIEKANPRYKMGAVPLEYVSQIRKPQQQQTSPLSTRNPLGQTMISGGAGSATPNPVQGPVEEPIQDPLHKPLGGSTIIRIIR